MASFTSPLIQNPEKASKIIGSKLTWQSYILILIFLLAALIRIKDIRAPGILVEREYTSAINARTFYFEHSPEIEPWRVEIAHKSVEGQPTHEPPLTEYVVSLLYRIAGREELWYSKIVTYSFWMIGGIFLYTLIKKVSSSYGALAATAYYLFIPSGILLSRSFQPDALMMMMFLISLYCILRYFDNPSLMNLLLAASLSSLSLLIRPLVLFALFGAFISLFIYYKKSWKVFFDQHFLVFFLISLALPAIYYGYGVFIEDYMRWKVTTTLYPYLYLRKEFWKGWFLLGINQVGLTALITALVGFWLLKYGAYKALSIGLGIGYLFFALIFNYHISTHSYYHIQLLPLISICITPTVDLLINALKGTKVRFWWLPIGGVTLIMLISGYFQLKGSEKIQNFEDPYTAREIGEIVNHSSRTVFIAYHYGVPLEYYGEFSGRYWSRSINYWIVPDPRTPELSVQMRLNELGFIPEYFIITHFDEYTTHHQDLKDYLIKSCSLLAQTDRYLIYNSCL